MDEITDLVDKYISFIKKLHENNKYYSTKIFNDWIKKDNNKKNRNKFIGLASDLTKKLDILKNTIKLNIDKYYYDNKINFIEIEKYFRDNDIPCYLIAQQEEFKLKGTKIVNSDDEPADYTCYILITEDDDIVKQHISGNNIEEINKNIELNLDALIKSGIVVVDNEEDTKTDISKNMIKYNDVQNSLNDY